MIHVPLLVRRAVAAVAGTALLTVGAAACDPAPASSPSYGMSAEASHVVTLVNDYRAANGLNGLAVAGDATSKAQQQADAMAASLTIYHSNLASGIDPGWYTIGENVGVGSSVDSVESAFESSAPHRANLLSTAYNQLGVGVAWGGDGRVYVAEEFVGR